MTLRRSKVTGREDATVALVEQYAKETGLWADSLTTAEYERVLKFDFKGYSKAKGWVGIGEGDEDWPDILKALAEVGYTGWATAEVAGGGRKELQDVADRMNKILQLD